MLTDMYSIGAPISFFPKYLRRVLLKAHLYFPPPTSSASTSASGHTWRRTKELSVIETGTGTKVGA